MEPPTSSSLPMEKHRRLRLLVLLLVVLILLSYGVYQCKPPASSPLPGYGEISQLHSFDSNVLAVPYKSKKGDATILWLTGKDAPAPVFSEIDQIQSFQPDLNATAYESKNADATVIWLSGTDVDQESPPHSSSTNRLAGTQP